MLVSGRFSRARQKNAHPPDRPGNRHCLSAGRNRAGHAFPAQIPGRPRLLSGRTHSAMVGASVFHCRNRNLDAHHHRYSRHFLPGQSDISSVSVRIFSRARPHRACPPTRIFPRRILHRLCTYRKAFRRKDAFRGCQHFPDYPRDSGGGARFGDRAGAQRRAGHLGKICGRPRNRLDHLVHARRRDESRHLDRRRATDTLSDWQHGNAIRCKRTNSVTVAQLILYLTGSTVTLFVLLHRIPGGWTEVTQVAAAAGHKLQFLDFSFSWSTKYTFWSGLIGGAFLTMASHGTDQIIVQRLLAARSQRDSRRALLASGVIVLIQFTVFLLIGVLLFVFARHVPLLAPGERADRVLPLFLAREMPPGLAGLLLASIIAVAMSNASGSLNSLAASSVLDFSRLWGKSLDSKSFLKLSRRMTLAWGLVLMAFGLMKWGPLLEAGLTVISFPFGSLLGLFLLGTLDRSANALGALIGMFAGLATILCVFQFTSVAFTWYFMIGASVTFAIGSMISRIKPDAQHDNAAQKGKSWQPEKS